MQIIGIIGTIIILIAIGTIIGIWVYLKRKSKPAYTTRYGCKVYCQEAKYMKKRKQDVEKEVDRFMMLTNFKFSKQRMIKVLEDLQIGFKSKPFSPEGNVISDAKLLSGVHIPDEKRIIVYVAKGKDLSVTAFSHELMHYMMLHVDGVTDSLHTMKEYWNLIGEGKK